MGGFKNYFMRVVLNRLLLAGFILALVGWFLLALALFGQYFSESFLFKVEEVAASQAGGCASS